MGFRTHRKNRDSSSVTLNQKVFNYKVVHFIENDAFDIDHVNIETSRATIWDSSRSHRELQFEYKFRLHPT